MAVRLSHTIFSAAKSLSSRHLIILHGLFGSKMNWRSFARRLTERHFQSVITVDLRNHGDSTHSDEMSYDLMSEDILALIKDLNLSNVGLIGHSMGGKVAMVSSLRRPDIIDRIVSIDIGPFRSKLSENIADYADLMLRVDLDTLAKELNYELPLIRSYLMNSWKEEIKSEGVRMFMLKNLTELNGKVRWKANASAIKTNEEKIRDFPFFKTSVFNKPALFLSGELSTYITLKDMDFVRTLFPIATLVCISNAGHWVHIDAPQKTFEVISSFMLKERNSF